MLIVAGFCLAILCAWFLLPIDFAAAVLSIIVVLTAAAAGIYWTWTGGAVSEIARSFGIFASLMIILGCMRVGIQKLSNILGALLPAPFGTKGHAHSTPAALRP